MAFFSHHYACCLAFLVSSELYLTRRKWSCRIEQKSVKKLTLCMSSSSSFRGVWLCFLDIEERVRKKQKKESRKRARKWKLQLNETNLIIENLYWVDYVRISCLSFLKVFVICLIPTYYRNHGYKIYLISHLYNGSIKRRLCLSSLFIEWGTCRNSLEQKTYCWRFINLCESTMWAALSVMVPFWFGLYWWKVWSF